MTCVCFIHDVRVLHPWGVSVRWVFLSGGCFCPVGVSVRWVFLSGGCFCPVLFPVGVPSVSGMERGRKGKGGRRNGAPLRLVRIGSFWVDFRCVHRLQPLMVCNQNVTLPIPPVYNAYPRNNPGKTFISNCWIFDWSFEVLGWHSTHEPNGIIGPLNGCPERLTHGRLPIR